MSDLRDLVKNPNAAELELVARYGALGKDARRARAFEAFASSGLPHRRMEQWKWTDVKAAVDAIEPPSKGTGKTDPFASAPGVELRFEGGRLRPTPDLPLALRIHEKRDAQAFGGAEDAPLGALAAALADAPAALVIEVCEPVDTPLRLVFAGEGADAAFARIAFVVRSGASLDLIESHLGGAGFSSVLIEFGLEDGAEVRRTLYQAGGHDEVAGITAAVHLNEGAAFTQTALSLGAKLARLETRLTHQGPAARATLNAAYLLDDKAHADFTSHVRHDAAGGVTRQTTRGAVRKGGHGVFQGKFHVARAGQRTDADMQHNALLLDDGATVNAKPELEIYADDVACAHGNTAGALDETALFYMRQRGLPLADARALLTEAFIAETLESAGPGQEALLDAARRWLRS